MNSKFSGIYGFLPDGIDGIESLSELALDIRWSWNHATDYLWQQIDTELWGLTHNPWLVLQTVSRKQLERQMGDRAFRERISEQAKRKLARHCKTI